MLADKWFTRLREDIHPLLAEIPDNGRRVKVAILDTGIDLDHADIMARDERIQDVRSWVNGKKGAKDYSAGDPCGHGTFATGLLLDVAPHVDVYVARIAENETLEQIFHIAEVPCLSAAL